MIWFYSNKDSDQQQSQIKFENRSDFKDYNSHHKITKVSKHSFGLSPKSNCIHIASAPLVCMHTYYIYVCVCIYYYSIIVEN